jgi:Family of unknown function (DUF6194)
VRTEGRVCQGDYVVELTVADLPDAVALLRAIQRELPGLVTTTGAGDEYVFYDPDGITTPDRRFPFITLMTGDRYDGASWLDRDEATYRVNVGVGREVYERLFGPAPQQPVGIEVIDTGHDYAATDTVLPHPFYAPLHWVCVVSPAEQTRELLADFLTRAHEIAQRQYERGRAREGD